MRLLLLLLGRLIDRFHRDLAAGPKNRRGKELAYVDFSAVTTTSHSASEFEGFFFFLRCLGESAVRWEINRIFFFFVQTAFKAFPVDCRIDGFSKGLNQRDNFPPRITRQAPFWFIRHDTSERRATESQSVGSCCNALCVSAISKLAVIDQELPPAPTKGEAIRWFFPIGGRWKKRPKIQLNVQFNHDRWMQSFMREREESRARWQQHENIL